MHGRGQGAGAFPLAPAPQLAPAVGLHEDAAFGPRGSARRPAARGRALAAARMAAGLFIGATVIYGIAIGGFAGRFADYAQDRIQAAVIQAGFTVRRLDIEGLGRTSRDEIVDALGFAEGAPIFSVDSVAAKQRLERLSWVSRAKVMRLLPSTVQVVIEERVPFAVWQINGKMNLIDAEGRKIAAVAREDYAALPLVVGEGAPREARRLFAALETHGDLFPRILAAVRVGKRRWTLKLKNGVEIKLPEERIAGALERLTELERARDILSADIKSVDLRLGDRISVRLSDAAAARRKEAAKQGGAAAGRDG